jgi:hypothetical protein
MWKLVYTNLAVVNSSNDLTVGGDWDYGVLRARGYANIRLTISPPIECSSITGHSHNIQLKLELDFLIYTHLSTFLIYSSLNWLFCRNIGYLMMTATTIHGGWTRTGSI